MVLKMRATGTTSSGHFQTPSTMRVRVHLDGGNPPHRNEILTTTPTTRLTPSLNSAFRLPGGAPRLVGIPHRLRNRHHRHLLEIQARHHGICRQHGPPKVLSALKVTSGSAALVTSCLRRANRGPRHLKCPGDFQKMLYLRIRRSVGQVYGTVTAEYQAEKVGRKWI